MACAIISGMIGNILLSVDDPGATTYSSGQVESMIFKNITTVNGLLGTCLSGVDGCISPDISGTVYQGIFEAIVARDLTMKSLMSASRTATLTSFQEGDSKVTLANSSQNLSALYKILNDQFDKLVNQTKYTLASQNPASVIGTDASSAPAGDTYIPIQNYYPRQS